MSVLRGVLIKQIVFKKNVWSGTKELSIITSVCIKRVSLNQGSIEVPVVSPFALKDECSAASLWLCY